MKIDRRKDGRRRAARIRQELGEILHGGMDGVPVCAPDCPKAGAERCSRPLLAAMQRDVDTIAQHLREVVFEEALKLSRSAGSGAGSGAGG